VPFRFSAAVPEGNYTVTVTLGGPEGAVTTVRAEARRLMFAQIPTAAGESKTLTFAVNVRRPQIAGGGSVHLKKRDLEPTIDLDWDDKLTLEFAGAHPSVHAIDIAPAPNATTVFILGDSTVTDQADEPYAAWGQMLPRFFGPDVAIANYAESGASLRSAMGSRRLEKVLSVMKPGDYLFIQYGHNDQKEHGPEIGAFTSYAADLKHVVEETRKRGGTAVLVTSMNRRRFDVGGKIVATLGDYPDAVRRVAHESGAPLIDLNEMSRTLFEAMGAEGTLKAFVHYPADTFPGQTAALKDDTHFNNYGAYELARCIVEGIRTAIPKLADHLRADTGHFDAAHPDPVATWDLPLSPSRAHVERPAGS
jgi:lysophospholipase L1-like esterase